MGDEQVGQVEAGESVQTGTQEQGTENQSGEQGFINQEAVNKAIGRQHAKFQTAEGQRLELVETNRKLEEQLAGFQATSAPVVPPVPDQYDEDFDRKMRERDTKINDKAKFDNQQETLRLQKENNQQQTQRQAQEAQQKVVTTFNSRTSELGLDSQEIERAAGTVLSYGVTEQLADYILKDPDGPLILKHLASNPMQLNELAGMDPMSAAVKISTEVRAEAQKLKPKQSQTPDPGMIINGNGIPESVDPLIAGATFE